MMPEMPSLPVLTKLWPFATNSEWNRPIPNASQHAYKPKAIRIPSLLSLLFLFTICLTWLQILVEKTVKPSEYYAIRTKHDAPSKRQEATPGQCPAPEAISQSIVSLQSQHSELCDSYTTSMKPWTTDLPPRMQSSFDDWLASYSSMEAQLEHAESCGSSQQTSSSLSSLLSQLTSSTSTSVSTSAGSSPAQITPLNTTAKEVPEPTRATAANVTQASQIQSFVTSTQSTLSLASNMLTSNFSSVSTSIVQTSSDSTQALYESASAVQNTTDLSNSTESMTAVSTPVADSEGPNTTLSAETQDGPLTDAENATPIVENLQTMPSSDSSSKVLLNNLTVPTTDGPISAPTYTVNDAEEQATSTSATITMIIYNTTTTSSYNYSSFETSPISSSALPETMYSEVSSTGTFTQSSDTAIKSNDVEAVSESDYVPQTEMPSLNTTTFMVVYDAPESLGSSAQTLNIANDTLSSSTEFPTPFSPTSTTISGYFPIATDDFDYISSPTSYTSGAVSGFLISSTASNNSDSTISGSFAAASDLETPTVTEDMFADVLTISFPSESPELVMSTDPTLLVDYTSNATVQSATQDASYFFQATESSITTLSLSQSYDVSSSISGVNTPLAELPDLASTITALAAAPTTETFYASEMLDSSPAPDSSAQLGSSYNNLYSDGVTSVEVVSLTSLSYLSEVTVTTASVDAASAEPLTFINEATESNLSDYSTQQSTTTSTETISVTSGSSADQDVYSTEISGIFESFSGVATPSTSTESFMTSEAPSTSNDLNFSDLVFDGFIPLPEITSTAENFPVELVSTTDTPSTTNEPYNGGTDYTTTSSYSETDPDTIEAPMSASSTESDDPVDTGTSGSNGSVLLSSSIIDDVSTSIDSASLPPYFSPTNTESLATITSAATCSTGIACDICNGYDCACTYTNVDGTGCGANTCSCSLGGTWACDFVDICTSTMADAPTSTVDTPADPSSANENYGEPCHKCDGADACVYNADACTWDDDTVTCGSDASCTIDWCYCYQEEDEGLICSEVNNCINDNEDDSGGLDYLPPLSTEGVEAVSTLEGQYTTDSAPRSRLSVILAQTTCDPFVMQCYTCDPLNPDALCQCDWDGSCLPTPCSDCILGDDGVTMMCPSDCEDEPLGRVKRAISIPLGLNSSDHLHHYIGVSKPVKSLQQQSHKLSTPTKEDLGNITSDHPETKHAILAQRFKYQKHGSHRRHSPQARGIWGVMDKRAGSEVLSEDAQIPLRDAWNYLLWTEPLTVRRTSSSTVTTTVLATFTLDVFPGGSTSWPSLTSTPPLAIVPRTPACIPATFIQPIPTHANIKRANEASNGKSAKAYVSREGTTVAVRIRDNYLELTSNLPTITQSASAGNAVANAATKNAAHSAVQTNNGAAGNTGTNGNAAKNADGSKSSANSSPGANSPAGSSAGSNLLGTKASVDNSASTNTAGSNSEGSSSAKADAANDKQTNGPTVGKSSLSSDTVIGNAVGSNTIVKGAAALQQMTTQTMVITSIGPDGVRHTQSVVVVRPTYPGNGISPSATAGSSSSTNFGTAGDGSGYDDDHGDSGKNGSGGIDNQLEKLSKNERIVNLPFTRISYLAALYLPAVMAVIIKILFETMVASIKMMEPFERLHRSQGSSAEESLCSQYLSSSVSWDSVRSMWTGRSIPLWTTIIYVFISIGAPLSAASMSVKPMDTCVLQGSLRPCDPAWIVEIQFIRLMEALLAICIALTLILMWASWTYHAGVPSNPTCIASIAVLLNYEPLRRDLQKIDADATEENLQECLSEYHFWLIPHNNGFGTMRYGIVHAQTTAKPSSHSLHPIFEGIEAWFTSLKSSIPHHLIVSVNDSLHLFTALALLALLTTYRADLRDDAFNRFFASNTFLPKLIMVSLASLLDMQCKNLEREVRVLEPYRRLGLGNARPENTILHTMNGTCWSNTPRCLRGLFQYPNMWFEAIVGLTAILSDVNIIAISGVLMTDSQTKVAYQLSSVTALATTSIVLLVVCITIFWWRRCSTISSIPRTPDTVGVVLSYLCASRMAKDFADMGMENFCARERDDVIIAKGRRFKFSKRIAEDGIERHCIDYDDKVTEEGDSDTESWLDLKEKTGHYTK